MTEDELYEVHERLGQPMRSRFESWYVSFGQGDRTIGVSRDQVILIKRFRVALLQCCENFQGDYSAVWRAVQRIDHSGRWESADGLHGWVSSKEIQIFAEYRAFLEWIHEQVAS